MRDLDVGSLPVCGGDRLRGMITDRDIVTKCIAGGVDPANVTAGELAHGMPVTIESQADVTEVLRAMEQHQIHRLPVIESQQPGAGGGQLEGQRQSFQPAADLGHRRHQAPARVRRLPPAGCVWPAPRRAGRPAMAGCS